MLRKPWDALVSVLAAAVLAAVVLSTVPFIGAAEQAIDLDGNPINGEESRVVTRVLQTYPVVVENVVYNNALGQSFAFDWDGAGPGAFESFVTEGPDVGTKWEWSTVSQVYSILGPARFARDSRGLPSFGRAPGGIFETGTPGAFTLPGKSVFPTQITVSSASLVSSFITFFSPEQTFGTCGGTFAPGRWEHTLTNNSDQAATFTVEEQGCCPEPQMILCTDGCQFYLKDPEHCGDCDTRCATDQKCDEGVCVCDSGVLCGDRCVDLQSDPENCGECGLACSGDEVCDAGSCVVSCGPGEVECGDRCVDLKTDPENCGDCGIVCPVDKICVEGSCEFPAPAPALSSRTTGRTANDGRRATIGPRGATRPGAERAGRAAARYTRALPGPERATLPPTRDERALTVVEAPICTLEPIVETIPAGGSFTRCNSGAIAGREVFTMATVQRDGEQVARGPCTLVVPSPETQIPEFLPSPVSVLVTDRSGDGLCQPGETCNLFVGVQNLGTAPFLNPVGTISSPPDAFNPLPVLFVGDVSPYPDFPAFDGAGDCETQPVLSPQTNLTSFSLILPVGQDSDVGRRFQLSLEGDGGTFDMPFVLGIGRACDPSAELDGETYDGLSPLQPPVDVVFVPRGGPVHTSTGTFNQTKTIPLKFQLLCGAQVLGPQDIDPEPQIIALTHETLGPQPLQNINGANGANPDDPFFDCGTSRCEYQLRTRDLPIGAYIISVRMPDSRVFEAGFTIRP